MFKLCFQKHKFPLWKKKNVQFLDISLLSIFLLTMGNIYVSVVALVRVESR